MSGRDETAAQIIGRIATRAHGIVTRRELLAAGVTKAQIDHRVATGTLIVEYPGVYRVGHRAPSLEARYMAAVRACGRGAALSGLAAAHVLGLVSDDPPAPLVTTPRPRRVDGVATVTCRKLDRRDVTTWRRIPITTVPRTLVDVAAHLDEAALGEACHRAGVRHRTTPRHVREVLGRRPNAPGAGKLKRILSGETKVTLSALERRFLQRLGEAGLPLPDETNRRAGSKRVDCRWIGRKLTVELDSYRFHNSRYSWEQDRRREREAYARGDAFRRYTWGDVFEHPHQMLSELAGLLAVADRPE